ncbi:MAG: Ig-like domain-containing protein [Candidatus Riflebacteria bacterium]|nr:Ig-like domain-containing protein [Candidatus Riflebacteria bacterium]
MKKQIIFSLFLLSILGFFIWGCGGGGGGSINPVSSIDSGPIVQRLNGFAKVLAKGDIAGAQRYFSPNLQAATSGQSQSLTIWDFGKKIGDTSDNSSYTFIIAPDGIIQSTTVDAIVKAYFIMSNSTRIDLTFVMVKQADEWYIDNITVNESTNAETFSAVAYFPMQSGDFWKYLSNDSRAGVIRDVTLSVSPNTQIIDGKRVFSIVSTAISRTPSKASKKASMLNPAGMTNLTWGISNDGGLWNYGVLSGSSYVFNDGKPLKILDENFKVGDIATWTVNEKINSVTYSKQIVIQVLQPTISTLIFGTLRTFPIRFTWHYLGGSSPDGVLSGAEEWSLGENFGLLSFREFDPDTNISWVNSDCQDARVKGVSQTPVTMALLQVALPIGIPGQSYSATLSAMGGTPPYSFQISSGSLPLGTSLASSTGIITGIPTSGGNYFFTAKVVDSFGHSATQDFSITIAAFSITTDFTSPVYVNDVWSAKLVSQGGTAPLKWSVASGSLPTGLSLVSPDSISGTVAAAGAFEFTLRAIDANNLEAYKKYSIQVIPALTITSNVPSSTLVNTPIAAVYSVTGGVSSYSFSLQSGNLPTGLSLSSDGRLTGSPTDVGTFTFAVQVVDSNGKTAQITSAIFVDSTTQLVIATGSVGAFTYVAATYSATLTANGATGALKWELLSGTIPPGITFNSNGTLSGISTTVGTFTFVVKVTDSIGKTGSAQITMTVANDLVISGSLPTAGEVNKAYVGSFTVSGGFPPYSFQLTTGNLPDGLSLSTSGNISGTPTATGTFSFRISVSDSKGRTTGANVSIQINPAPAPQPQTLGIVSVFPADGATGVGTGTSITILFNKAMDSTTFTTTNITLVANPGLLTSGKSISASGRNFVMGVGSGTPVLGNISFSGDKTSVTFTPSSPLSYLTNYTATVKAAVKDGSGNSLGQDKVWAFTTVMPPDTTPPTIASVSPASGATGIAVNAPLVVQFSEPMDVTTLTAANITLATQTMLLTSGRSNSSSGRNIVGAGLGTQIPGNILVSVDKTSVTFTPSSPLANLTTYIATVKAAVKDAAGNNMLQDQVWSFTTVMASDTTPPTIISVLPTENATAAPIIDELIIRFSEPMDINSLSTASILLSPGVGQVVNLLWTPDSTSVTFRFLPPLTNGTFYTATVKAGVKDLAGNPMASDKVWSFTTVSAPLVITTPSFLPSANVSNNFSYPLTVGQASGPITWSLVGGNLPPGVSILPTAAIGGSPTTVGSYSFQIQGLETSTGRFATKPFQMFVLPQNPGLFRAIPKFINSTTVEVSFADMANDQIPASIEPSGLGLASFTLTEIANLKPGQSGAVTSAATNSFPIGVAFSPVLGVATLTFQAGTFDPNSPTLFLSVVGLVSKDLGSVVNNAPEQIRNHLAFYAFQSWSDLGMTQPSGAPIKLLPDTAWNTPTTPARLFLVFQEKIISIPIDENLSGNQFNLNVFSSNQTQWYTGLNDPFRDLFGIGNVLLALRKPINGSLAITQQVLDNSGLPSGAYGDIIDPDNKLPTLPTGRFLEYFQVGPDSASSAFVVTDNLQVTSIRGDISNPSNFPFKVVAEDGNFSAARIAAISADDGGLYKLDIAADGSISQSQPTPYFTAANPSSINSKVSMVWMYNVLDSSAPDNVNQFVVTEAEQNRLRYFNDNLDSNPIFTLDTSSQLKTYQGRLNAPSCVALFTKNPTPMSLKDFWILVADADGMQYFRMR